MLKKGTDPVDGIYDSSVDPTKFPGPSAVQYDRNQNDNKLLDLSTRAGHEQFILDLSDSPTLLEFVGKLMDGWKEPFRFRRQLLRTNIPRSYKTATRVHYDQMYLRRMEPGAVTGWIPIGDVSPISGGLMYLEDSMPLGLEIERAFMNINSTLPKEEQLSAFNQNVGLGDASVKLTCRCCMAADSRRTRAPSRKQQTAAG